MIEIWNKNGESANWFKIIAKVSYDFFCPRKNINESQWTYCTWSWTQQIATDLSSLCSKKMKASGGFNNYSSSKTMIFPSFWRSSSLTPGSPKRSSTCSRGSKRSSAASPNSSGCSRCGAMQRRSCPGNNSDPILMDQNGSKWIKITNGSKLRYQILILNQTNHRVFIILSHIQIRNGSKFIWDSGRKGDVFFLFSLGW